MSYFRRQKLAFSIVFALSLAWAMEASSRAQSFASHALVNNTLQDYSYTLYNDEPVGSSFYIANFTLTLPEPISFNVMSSPTGWNVSTDNRSFVFWYNTDLSLPYPNDVAPGNSLDGFSIQSTVPSSAQFVSDEIDAWDHSLDQPGPTVVGNILGPQVAINAVPEPSVEPFLGAIALGSGGLLFGVWRRSRRSKTS